MHAADACAKVRRPPAHFIQKRGITKFPAVWPAVHFSDSLRISARAHHDLDGTPTAPLPPPRGETYQRLQLPKLRDTAGEGGIRQKPQFGGVSSTRASCCNDFETDEIDGIKASWGCMATLAYWWIILHCSLLRWPCSSSSHYSYICFSCLHHTQRGSSGGNKRRRRATANIEETSRTRTALSQFPKRDGVIRISFNGIHRSGDLAK